MKREPLRSAIGDDKALFKRQNLELCLRPDTGDLAYFSAAARRCASDAASLDGLSFCTWS
jgi:hypothetical protein